MLRFFSIFFDYIIEREIQNGKGMISMKKTVLCILLILAVLSAAACAKEKTNLPDLKEKASLDVVIEKIYEETLYVRILDGNDYLFVNRCDTVTQNGEHIAENTLSVGDGIRVIYDGELLGNSPAQIANVYEIVLTDPVIPAQ